MPNETQAPAVPLTRLEQYWAGILEKIEGGGGGNPNYVETITGTLEDPWGEVDASVLAEEIISANVSAYLDVDATALGMGEAHLVATPYESATVISFQAIGRAGSTLNDWQCALGSYDSGSGALQLAFILSSGSVTNVVSYASVIPTTLTIVHHPLPDTP